MKLRHTLRIKMIIGFVIVIAPLVSFLSYLNYYSMEMIRAQAAQAKNDLLQVYFDGIDKNIDRVSDFLYKLVLNDPDLKSLGLHPYASRDYIFAKYLLMGKLGVELEEFPDAENFFVYRTDRDEFIATSQFQDKFLNNFDLPAFKETIRADRTDRWIIVRSRQEAALIKLVPADVNLVAGAWIRLDRLIAPLQSVESVEGSESEAVILSREGEALTPSRFATNGLTAPETGHTYSEAIGPDKRKFLVIAKQSELAPFTIAVSIPEQQLFRSLLFYQKAIYLIPLAAALIIVLFIAVLQNVVYKPMRTLLRGMAKVGKGDLSVTLHSSDKGELGYVLNSFNEMVARIREIDIWETQRPVIIDKFWQDLLSGRQLLNVERLETMISLFKKPLASDGFVIPILISASQWKQHISAEDETTMEYALRNAAGDIVLNGLSGDVIQDRNGTIFALVYLEADAAGKLETIQAQIDRNCASYLDACLQYFCSSLCCYVGEPSPLLKLSETYYALLELERHHVTAANTVYYQKDMKSFSAQLPSLYWLPDWAIPFKFGKWDSVREKLEETFGRLEQGVPPAKEAMEGIYYGTLYTLYTIFHENGIPVYSVYQAADLNPPAPPLKSVLQLKRWTFAVVHKGIPCFQQTDQQHDGIVAKIMNYVAAHLKDDLSREELAEKVYLNPSYLSRLFKKETGQSLSDYIGQVRMEEARRLLSQTNMKIVQVAEESGYRNVSHFTKMFKRMTGVTPQEYRSKYLGDIG
ncbi:helix-turn-helix domain-containing protein [Paenibacillus hemerocallicola]|uniref:Helix-turn-helix domain-containing protein n=1 Tax=Paenibacillus hemerocallicola TaxID=1172614 RepID=A0A5C4SZD4_9BACL|nr:helix-turn-helix domain-containing protein [Paenibacillus hemerocallicola]TNJ62036.1 helix-turn-helix domain-containing protein [Paenibacillus hemerocallicola]